MPKAVESRGHVYTSTACHHHLHYDCRVVCKFCFTKCECECHKPKVEPL